MNDQLPTFRNNKRGKIYTIFLTANINSDREDFPETYVYFDEDLNLWYQNAKEFLSENTRILENE